MPQSLTDIFFALLRYSLGADVAPIAEPLSDYQWKQIFALSQKQSLLGLIYSGIQRLPENLQPPSDLMDRWSQLMIKIMAGNSLMNATAAKLTQMFAEHGRKTIILKGQANALLYPDPYVRQAGDIDILVEGGRNSVLKLLDEMNLMEGADPDCGYHVHLDGKHFRGVAVEVHYVPTVNSSPISNRRMQRFFAEELAKSGAVSLSKEGFYIPPHSYALVMQLSHLLHHYYCEGIGLRQMTDYYLLLNQCSESDRSVVSACLRSVGLYHVSGALMWIMKCVFALPENLMLCKPDERRGRLLYDQMHDGGNFGKYSEEYVKRQSRTTFQHWIANRMGPLNRISFDVSESVWQEINYLGKFVKSIPLRIRNRSFSLRNISSK